MFLRNVGTIYQTAWCHNAEDFNLLIYRDENCPVYFFCLSWNHFCGSLTYAHLYLFECPLKQEEKREEKRERRKNSTAEEMRGEGTEEMRKEEKRWDEMR